MAWPTDHGMMTMPQHKGAQRRGSQQETLFFFLHFLDPQPDKPCHVGLLVLDGMHTSVTRSLRLVLPKKSKITGTRTGSRHHPILHPYLFFIFLFFLKNRVYFREREGEFGWLRARRRCNLATSGLVSCPHEMWSVASRDRQVMHQQKAES